MKKSIREGGKLMFTVESYTGTLEEKYSLLNKQLAALIEGEDNLIAILSNTSALLNVFLKEINWVGFYLLENNMLVLGPFQGKIACSKIKVGKGVCGACAQTLKTINVKNVHEFEGHIACDSRSNSELVVPVIINNKFYCLIDIDSPLFERFTKEDETLIEEISKLICQYFNN